MAEVVGTLAFLITLDVALAVTLLLGHRWTRASYLMCGFYMMCFETARQVLSAIISAWPDVYALQLSSSALDFGCALMMTSAVFGVTGKRLRRAQVILACVVYLASLALAAVFPIHIIVVWLLANIAPIGLHTVMVYTLLKLDRRGSIATVWLTGIVVLSMLFRLAMPFAVAASESLFGLTYLLDSVVVAIVGATLGLLAIERLAESYREQKEYQSQTAEMIRTILDVAYDAIVGTDPDGVITVWSDAAVKTFGWSKDEATGKRIDELLPGFKRAPNSFGKIKRVETRTRSGDPVTVDSMRFAADRPDGKIIVRIVRDVTAQLRAESELRILEQQMEQARRMESLGAFAGGVAHDYNNLLAAIMGFADLALHDAAPGSPIEQNLREILGAADRGADLTHRILEYAGRTPSRSMQFDAAAEAHAMTPLLKSVMGKNAALEWNIDENPLPIFADKAQFGQILLNLAANASEALAGESGTVRILTDHVPGDSPDIAGCLLDHRNGAGLFARIRVSDTGRGISERDMNKLLDPFYTTKPTGRGLGMATVSAIVRAHEGALKIESVVQEGTTVSVFLPLCDVDEPKEAVDSARGSGASAEASNGGRVGAGETVLVVDDEESIRTAVAKTLERAGFDVLTAADGAECLDRLAEANGSVRLIVLDCNMPRMDGNAALAEILRRDENMPVLMSSGRPDSMKHRDRPNVRFIRKPYRASELIAQVGELFRN